MTMIWVILESTVNFYKVNKKEQPQNGPYNSSQSFKSRLLLMRNLLWLFPYFEQSSKLVFFIKSVLISKHRPIMILKRTPRKKWWPLEDIVFGKIKL